MFSSEKIEMHGDVPLHLIGNQNSSERKTIMIGGAMQHPEDFYALAHELHEPTVIIDNPVHAGTRGRDVNWRDEWLCSLVDIAMRYAPLKRIIAHSRGTIDALQLEQYLNMNAEMKDAAEMVLLNPPVGTGPSVTKKVPKQDFETTELAGAHELLRSICFRMRKDVYVSVVERYSHRYLNGKGMKIIKQLAKDELEPLSKQRQGLRAFENLKSSISVPTLVMTSREDPWNTDDEGRPVEIPGNFSRVISVEADHYLHLSATETVRRQIDEFSKSNSAKKSPTLPVQIKLRN